MSPDMPSSCKKNIIEPVLYCSFCEESLINPVNFTYRLRRAPKLPKKSLRLYRSSSSSEIETPNNQSKFSKYIIRRANPHNVVEVKCLNCRLTTSDRTSKPRYTALSKSITPIASFTSTPGVTPLSKEERKQRKKAARNSNNTDRNAGLFIPSPSSISPSPKLLATSTPTNKLSSSLLFTSQLPEQTPTSHMGNRQRIPPKRLHNMMLHEKKVKEKEADQLRKMLIKSKAMSASCSTSLSNFLGR